MRAFPELRFSIRRVMGAVLPALMTLAACQGLPPSGLASEWDGRTAVYASSHARLTLDAVQVIQTVQTMQNTVPLLQGKDAFVRVFVHADRRNALRPDVRVRLYHGSV